MIKIEFHGAAKTVTGSNYVVRTEHGNFVVDAGMFQGQDVEARNLEEYAYNGSDIDFAVLTHAHIDHSGMLPKLYKSGFRGPIYATNHTIQISQLLLEDSAKIQENNFRKGLPYGKYTKEVALVFNMADAEATNELFKPARFQEEFEPIPGIKLKFTIAGHVLGAATIEATIKDSGGDRKIVFSGDIGRQESPLIPTFDPEYRTEADYLVMESLYGGKIHESRKESVERMINVINETIERGGNVFIPSFSVQRSQEIMHDLKHAIDDGKLSKDIPVWLDSPLAQRVSFIYMAALQSTPENLFLFDSLKFVKQVRQSQMLTKKKGQIIIAGSGMADGGRILGHFEHGLGNSKNSAVFVGYQAEGTLGRELVDGAEEIMISKTKVKVNAEIHFFGGFSAHGDDKDYTAWVNRYKGPRLKKVFLVHAEEERAQDYDKSLDKIGVMDSYIPGWKEVVELD